MKIRIGTRGSNLARWQAEFVAAELSKRHIATELVFLKTLGDLQQSGPIGEVGSQGVFTKEIQRALIDEQVDLAVHSLKDLPTDRVPGLRLAAVPTRENEGDALVARNVDTLEALPEGAIVATGSMRRKAQLLAFRHDLQVVDVRGNVETRLQKLHDEPFDALILAEAGLMRLGLTEQITQIVPKSIMLPAVGQGALGLEIREDDTGTHEAVSLLDDASTHAAVLAERSLLRSLRGGCLAPIGAWGRIAGAFANGDPKLQLDAVVLSPDGTEILRCFQESRVSQAESLGQQVAADLLADGAGALLEIGRE